MQLYSSSETISEYPLFSYSPLTQPTLQRRFTYDSVRPHEYSSLLDENYNAFNLYDMQPSLCSSSPFKQIPPHFRQESYSSSHTSGIINSHNRSQPRCGEFNTISQHGFYASHSRRKHCPGVSSSARSWEEADLISHIQEERRTLPPGENNPNAIPGGKLCFEYMNKGRWWWCWVVTGRCQRMENGRVCRFRHLVPYHPEAIADRFRSGLLSKEDIEKYRLRECEPYETNPFAPKDAKICFEFLNRHVCSRNQDMKICRFRHLLPEHPDAIQDRIKSMGERKTNDCDAEWLFDVITCSPQWIGESVSFQNPIWVTCFPSVSFSWRFHSHSIGISSPYWM